MPSSKGKPTDPKLREKVKNQVKAKGEGGAPGQWTANKSSRMAQEYEKQGGGYENKPDGDAEQKYEAKAGDPQPKKKAPATQKRKAAGDAKKAKKPTTKKSTAKKTETKKPAAKKGAKKK